MSGERHAGRHCWTTVIIASTHSDNDYTGLPHTHTHTHNRSNRVARQAESRKANAQRKERHSEHRAIRAPVACSMTVKGPPNRIHTVVTFWARLCYIHPHNMRRTYKNCKNILQHYCSFLSCSIIHSKSTDSNNLTLLLFLRVTVTELGSVV